MDGYPEDVSDTSAGPIIVRLHRIPDDWVRENTQLGELAALIPVVECQRDRAECYDPRPERARGRCPLVSEKGDRPIPWAAIPLFQSLKPAERESLRPLVRIKSYDESQTIFREGEPALMFHFILGGRVKIVKAAAPGRDVILEIFGAGDPVGAVAAYEERAFPATAVALESTSLLSVPRQEFFALLASNPMLARGLLLGLTRRMVELTRKIAERSSRVEYRMARLFLTLADRLGRPQGSAMRIPVPLSRQDLADMVGTTQETAIRIMSRWGKDNLVATETEGFLIPDRRRLEEIPPEN